MKEKIQIWIQQNKIKIKIISDQIIKFMLVK